MVSAVKKEDENKYLQMKKESRCRDFCKSPQIPNSYKDNTLKEELILEHVIQFKKEFNLSYPGKRDLFLFPQNECGKYKFICTTVRPTKVPYPELYDSKKCAKFVSEYFEYEELNPPTKFPEYIPAPENVVKWQIGDCFDLSIVLCSLLIGAGYNAYVIYGTAPRFITSKDETRMSAPEMIDDIKVIEPNLEEKEDDTQVTIPDKARIYSVFNETEKANQEEEKRQEVIKNTVIDDDMGELERYDPFKDRRMHCWVLIRKSARLEIDTFVEPSTGRIYDIKNPPYEKVDCLFNNYNFYINLNMDKKIEELDWNLNNGNNWEYVMLNSKDSTDDMADVINPDEQENAGEGQGPEIPTTNLILGINPPEEEKVSEILDMPPPWPNKILIPLKNYNNRSPTATQVFFYEKTKVEKFAPCSQSDGLTMKIFNYKDFARFLLISVEHRYRNRGDKLFKKLKYPYEHKIIDYYLPGQPWHWKTIEEVEASYKKVWFYPTNFEHCIIYREEIFGEKILHQYVSRDDRVFERKILLDKTSKEKQTSYRYFIDSPLYENKILIVKFTQKTNTNPLNPPEGQIFKLSYRFDQGTHIQVINHFGKSKILSKPELFLFEDESSMTNGEKDDTSKKMDDDKEIWKRMIYTKKAQYIEDFKKIEDFYNFNYEDSLKFNKRIADNRYLPAETNKSLYEKGNDFPLPILEKSIFDLDQLLVSNNKFLLINHRVMTIKTKTKMIIAGISKSSIALLISCKYRRK